MDNCAIPDCERNAHRHLAGYYFCTEHNWKLRVRAVEEKPDSIFQWVEEMVG